MILKFQSSKLMSAFQSVEEYIADRDGERKAFWVMEIKRARARRSLNQNNYWWAICTIIAIHVGCTKENIHKLLCLENNATIINLPNGKIKLVPNETRELNTEQFSQLIEKARTWAQQELGLYIPTPEEHTEEMRIRLLNQYEQQFY